MGLPIHGPQRKIEFSPDSDQGRDQFVYDGVIVVRRRRNAQTLRPSWNRWIVDGLDIGAVVRKQHIARQFALTWVTDQHWDDMGIIADGWDAGGV